MGTQENMRTKDHRMGSRAWPSLLGCWNVGSSTTMMPHATIIAPTYCGSLYRVRRKMKEMTMDAGIANCISSVTCDGGKRRRQAHHDVTGSTADEGEGRPVHKPNSQCPGS